jgi:hypothetical protein
VSAFGKPRTGDKEFARVYNSLVPQHIRVVHHRETTRNLPLRVKYGPILTDCS